MGIPLVLVALFGHRLLPKSGPWMQQVKQGFDFIILALPVFLLERILGDSWGERLWSLLAVAFFGWSFLLCLQARWRGRRWLTVLLRPDSDKRATAAGLAIGRTAWSGISDRRRSGVPAGANSGANHAGA